MKNTVRLLMVLICVVLGTGLTSFAMVPDTDTIPPELERWKPWVLHGQEAHFCPITYNNGEAFQCVWPSRLNLFLDQKGGRFSQEWQVFVKDWVGLPVSPGSWPQEVKVDGAKVPVVTRQNLPVVRLAPGKHMVEGTLVWLEMPEMMNVPPSSGLVSLSMDGKPVDLPLFDGAGRLWLQQRAASGKQEDRLETKIYRLIEDTIPMRVTSVLRVNISGQAREVKLDNVLLEKTVPTSINSPLPARLGTNGELHFQARPGRWEIRIATRFEGPVHQIGPTVGTYGQEVWAFQAHNQLRMVQVEGVPGVDPKQTDTPAEWHNFPTYIVQPYSAMKFQEIRRGDPDPAPDILSMKRTWWLDFNGSGYTVEDRIGGTMSRQWHLAMDPPGILGRATVDGTDQLITAQGPDRKAGVELRKGRLNLVAESRYEASRDVLPAVGWDHDFQSVSAVLNLPPGWRLLTAAGVDIMPGTWFERWTLLDLFLVLITSLAVARLWNMAWGVLALAALGLSYHEPGAPQIVWLSLLAAVALLRFLPSGWARRTVSLYRMGSLIVLLVISIPFMVQQIRWGIYPQLEPIRPIPVMVSDMDMGQPGESLQMQEEPSVAPAPRMAPAAPPRKAGKAMKEKDLYYAENRPSLTQDPNALIQTGPGLPTWTWRTIAMKWNGPVARTQQIRLWLLSPAINLVLAFLRVVLLALLIFLVIDARHWREWKELLPSPGITSLLILAILLTQVAAAEERTSAFPPEEMLQQLQKRLMEHPDCLPQCAESSGMELIITPDSLTIVFQVHSAVETAVPLPGNTKSWLPEKVLLDNQPAEGVLRDKDGVLWALAPAGLHTLKLLGKVPSENSFQLALPLKPRSAKVESAGWDIQGIHRDGQIEANIQLTRQRKEGERPSESPGAALPPFLQIERTLLLGLNWQVQTKVRRMTPLGTPVVAEIPVIAGESVTTPGLRVSDGKVLVNMEPGISETEWSSTLDRSAEIRLQATSGDGRVSWAETWILDAGPIWHCDPAGIPVIHHQDRAGFWKPQWEPWPGESVTVSVTRPEAIPGQLVTIENAKLELTPGERFDKGSLELTIRASQGGQHPIVLPANASLQQVSINGASQPIKQQGRTIVIPLQPGSQKVSLEWHTDRETSLLTVAPDVSVGDSSAGAVNADVTIKMGPNRWILWAGGPTLGPAVLFWSTLVVVLLVAAGLGKIPWTPLKTRHWVLLGLGLTQVDPLVAILIVGWLMALAWRERQVFPDGWLTFDLTQWLLAAWTLAALGGLYLAVEGGLLGIPQMQIAGNGSSDFLLRWTQDRIASRMPQPWVISLPMFVYRVLMLLWALWLALALLKWLRWGWQCFSKGGLWRKPVLRRAQPPRSV